MDVHPRHPQIKRGYFKNPVHCATDFVSDGNSLLLRLFLGMFFNAPKSFAFFGGGTAWWWFWAFPLKAPKTFRKTKSCKWTTTLYTFHRRKCKERCRDDLMERSWKHYKDVEPSEYLDVAASVGYQLTWLMFFLLWLYAPKETYGIETYPACQSLC